MGVEAVGMDEPASGGALERLLRSAYGAFMFQLPPPPDIGPQIDELKRRGRSLADMLPSIPVPMPTAPEWMQRYMVERGLLPDERRSGLTPEGGSWQP